MCSDPFGRINWIPVLGRGPFFIDNFLLIFAILWSKGCKILRFDPVVNHFGLKFEHSELVRSDSKLLSRKILIEFDYNDTSRVLRIVGYLFDNGEKSSQFIS